ncbi:mesoderm posterior ba [Xyrauchen texanus]|uniref:mesoderm posterior ba n=1 Tax=Xyrauchen texanus TaxID=154827 RepID=UPI002241F591|nr:mesoderm posterior ba [Xyrauchen texanus]
MEISSHNQQNQWSYPSSDSEFYSVSSPDTVSPAASMDQGFSPSHPDQPTSSKSIQPPASQPGSIKRKCRLRLKNPSEQRQNASEKEKLRMRDLTKALHHLRTYLPPSMAPVGQTLTKIETLRLTIHYISFLSAQLGLSKEELEQRKQINPSNGCPYSPEIVGYFQCRSTAGQRAEEGQGYGHDDGQYQDRDSASNTGQFDEMNVDQCKGNPQQHSTEQLYSPDIDKYLQSQQLAQTAQSYPVYIVLTILYPPFQVYGRKSGYQLVPQVYWS